MMRRAAFAVGVLTVLAVPASASAALLDTVKVDAAATTVTKGKVTLIKGRAYTLNVSGTFTEVAANGTGHRYDALFCVAGLGEAQNDCTDHPRAGDFRVTTGDTTFKDVEHFGGPVQSYAAGHSYSVRFTPPANGVLRAGTARAYRPCASCAERANGTVTVQVLGQSHVSKGSGGGTSKTTSSSSTASAKVSTHRPECRANLRAAVAASNPWCPFGVLGVLPAPSRNVAADVSSAPLPSSTRALNLVADLQDPHGEGFFDEYVVTSVKANTPVEGQVAGCLIVGAASVSGPVAFTYSGRSTLVACATLALNFHGRRHSCHTVFVPGFETGSDPTPAMRREARRRMEASVNASCSRPHKTQVGARLTAPAGQDLNGVFGDRARAATGAYVRVGVSPSRSARLVYGWGVASG